jgi:hypothetical protein
MSSYLIITEKSIGKLALRFVQSDCKIVLNLAALDQWKVGDTVALEINKPPYRVAFDSDGEVQFSLPNDLPSHWEKSFYRLRNESANDFVNIDFDAVKGWEGIAKEARRQNLSYPVGGSKNARLTRGAREL